MKRMKKITSMLLLVLFVLLFAVPTSVLAGELPEEQNVDTAEQEITIPEQDDTMQEPEIDLPEVQNDAELVQEVQGESVPEGEVTEQEEPIIATQDTVLSNQATRTFRIPGTFFVHEYSAVLAAESEHAVVYVQKDYLSGTETTPLSSFAEFLPADAGENAKAKAIANEFDTIYRFLSTPGAQTYYAQPYNLNGNGKVILFLCDIGRDGKESGGTVGGYVSGLFNTLDFNTTASGSNKGAILYLDVAPNQGYAKLKNDSKGFYQTVAHEYAHLLSYSCVYTNRQAGEKTNPKDVFAEEAFAELAAYLYGNKFGSGKLDAFFTSQFLPHYGFLDWQNSSIYMNANYGAAVLMALTYYNHGGNINNFLMDARYGSGDTYKAWGDHYVGASSPTTNYSNFNILFNQFALDTFVSDPQKTGPHISNVSFDSWDMIDLYGQPVIKPGEKFYYSAQKAPYMPEYFVRPRMGTRLGINENVIKITLTDTTAKSRFYVVYPNAPFAQGFGKNTGRTYTELIPGQQMTIPVGQGNEFAVLGVNYDYSGTAATINYTAAKDTAYPFTDVQIPDVQNIKAEHAKNGVVISWSAPANLPSGATLDSYEVYRDGKLLGTVSGSTSSPSRTDSYTGLTEGQSYQYTVKTLVRLTGYSSKLSSDGASISFKLAAVTVGKPSNLTAKPTTSSTAAVNLTWEKAPALYSGSVRQMAASKYEIYRDNVLIYTTSSAQYTDNKDIKRGKKYTYKLRSVYTSGSNTIYSDYTASVTVTVPNEMFTFSITAQAGGTVSSSPAAGEHPADTEIKIKAQANSGYVFSGWTSNSGGSFGDQSAAVTTFIMPENDVSVQAMFEEDSRQTPEKDQFSYSLTAKTYNGSGRGVTVTPKSGVGKITAIYYTGTAGTNYKKSTAKPKNIGMYKVSVDVAAGTDCKAAKGLVLGSFRIVPRKNSISKITPAKKQMKVMWKKVSAAQKVTRYEVRYRVRGTSAWKKKSYTASASSATIKGLKKGKQYQVQVRCYKTISGKKYYSAWSAAKTSGKIK